MTNDKSKNAQIPRKTHTRNRVILMPRFGVKTIVVKEQQITLPYVRFIDAAPAAMAGA